MDAGRGHFLLNLNLPDPKAIQQMSLYYADASGNRGTDATRTEGQLYDTTGSVFPKIAVFYQGAQQDNGYLNRNIYSGNLDLYAADKGWFRDGNWWALEVAFVDGTKRTEKTLIGAGGIAGPTESAGSLTEGTGSITGPTDGTGGPTNGTENIPGPADSTGSMPGPTDGIGSLTPIPVASPTADTKSMPGPTGSTGSMPGPADGIGALTPIPVAGPTGALGQNGPDISGDWEMVGRSPFTTGASYCSIIQQGDSLAFVNEKGEQSSGGFMDASTVVANEWGGLTGIVSNDGSRIDWANGSVWIRPSSGTQYYPYQGKEPYQGEEQYYSEPSNQQGSQVEGLQDEGSQDLCFEDPESGEIIC